VGPENSTDFRKKEKSLVAVLYPKLMMGWDCRTSTEKEVVEYVGILKN